MYWLAKTTGIRYATVWKLSKSEVGRLSIDALDRICEALDCQPGELLVRLPSAKERKGKR